MKLKYILVTIILISAVSPSLHAQDGFDAAPVLKTSETITGQPIRYPTTKNPEVSSVLVTIKVGGESGRHKHPVSPHIYVIEGQVTIEFDDGKRQQVYIGGFSWPVSAQGKACLAVNGHSPLQEA